MSTSVWFYLIVVAAGVSVALQQVLNANFRTAIGSAAWSGFVSYLVGTLVMLAAGLATGAPRFANGTAPSWFAWTGGVFGAVFIGINIIMIPRLGAATVLALIVVGQMCASMVFDHFGILGLRQQAISPARLLGAALLIAGVVLIRR